MIVSHLLNSHQVPALKLEQINISHSQVKLKNFFLKKKIKAISIN